jgi:hypothetical protein
MGARKHAVDISTRPRWRSPKAGQGACCEQVHNSPSQAYLFGSALAAPLPPPPRIAPSLSVVAVIMGFTNKLASLEVAGMRCEFTAMRIV